MSLINVANVEHRLGRKQEQIAGSLLLLLAVKLHAAGRASLAKGLLISHQHLVFHLGILVVANLGNLLHAADAVLNSLEVLNLQLSIDNLLIPHGVNTAVNVHHIVIVEAAQHVENSICLTDVGQELIAQSFALAGALHQSGNINNLHRGGHHAPRVDYLGQLVKAFVRHSDYAHIRLYCAEREICCLCLGIAQTVEKGRFAHIWQADNTAL